MARSPSSSAIARDSRCDLRSDGRRLSGTVIVMLVLSACSIAVRWYKLRGGLAQRADVEVQTILEIRPFSQLTRHGAVQTSRMWR